MPRTPTPETERARDRLAWHVIVVVAMALVTVPFVVLSALRALSAGGDGEAAVAGNDLLFAMTLSAPVWVAAVAMAFLATRWYIVQRWMLIAVGPIALITVLLATGTNPQTSTVGGISAIIQMLVAGLILGACWAGLRAALDHPVRR